MADEKKYPPIYPHGGLEKVSDTVYWVPGSFRMLPGVRIGVTMTIVKREDGLTIFNSVRVSKEVEDEIKKLGTIKNVVRTVAHHGASDGYYVDTFKAAYWDLPGAAELEGATKVPKTDNLMSEGVGGLPPFPDANVTFVKNTTAPEAMILLPDDGGTLICGDFIQNGRPTPKQSFGGKTLKTIMGFNTGCCNTPKLYFQAYGKKGQDIYEPNVPAVLALEFDTIISAHGPPMKGGARDDVKKGWTKTPKSDMWKHP